VTLNVVISDPTFFKKHDDHHHQPKGEWKKKLVWKDEWVKDHKTVKQVSTANAFTRGAMLFGLMHDLISETRARRGEFLVIARLEIINFQSRILNVLSARVSFIIQLFINR
jgi:hypothetical protein